MGINAKSFADSTIHNLISIIDKMYGDLRYSSISHHVVFKLGAKRSRNHNAASVTL